jgi:phosphoglycolate phosphatase
MKYELVIFAFDGTLADTFPWFLQVVNTLADAHKFKRVEAHEVETLRGYDARMVIRLLGIPWWKMPLVANHLRKLAAASGDHIALFEGTDRLLHRLSQHGITLAIVTSNSDATVRRALGPETARLIQYYACGVSTFGKPSRFRKIVKASGVSRCKTLVVGDELRDLEAAARAGIPFGAVGWGFTHIEALKAHAPAEVFVHMDDLLHALT